MKSAEAVAALEASGLNLACHTAPLCPMKVPILCKQFSILKYAASKVFLPVPGNSIAKHGVSICNLSVYAYQVTVGRESNLCKQR